MAILGGVLLNTVFADAPSRSATATTKPVESGESIADHIETAPLILRISGVVSGSDAAARLKRLETIWDKKQVVSYVNRVKYDNLVIEQFDSNHGKETKDGFTFSLSLKRIKISKASEVKGLKLPQKAQLGKVKNKGRQQPNNGKPTTTVVNTSGADFLQRKGLE